MMRKVLIVAPGILLAAALCSGRQPSAPASLGNGRDAVVPALGAVRQEPWAAAEIGFDTVAQRGRWRFQGEGFEIGFAPSGAPASANADSRELRLAIAPGVVFREGSFGVALLHLAAGEARGRHLRLSASIRSSAITRGWAGLWLRVDGTRGVLAFDNMGDRGVHDTTGWLPIAVEADVPAAAVAISLGVLLAGNGAVFVRDLAVSLGPLSQVVVGRVLDTERHAVAGALVAAVIGEVGKVDALVTSDWNGSFRTQVTNGHLTLTATAGGIGMECRPAIESAEERAFICEPPPGAHELRGEVRTQASLPPAGTHIVLARAEEDGGGVFLGTLDAAGRFWVRLPPATYEVSVEGGDYSLSPAVVRLDRDAAERQVSFTPSRLVPVPDQVVLWLRQHVAPLRTASPGEDLSDLRPLAGIVGQARVVGLGEATHGSREFFQLKHRVFEYLVTELGFTVFAIEAGWPEALALDDFVLTGKGDPAKALASLFSVWDTVEVFDLIQWIRAYNADPAHARKLRFAGFDMQSAGAAKRFIAAYLERVDPRFAAEIDGSLAAFPDEPQRAPRATSVAALTTARGLLARFDLMRDTYTAASSEEGWELVRQHATILEQSATLAASPEPDTRDRAMADNVEWILAHKPAGCRMVLWAHNGHVSYSRDRGAYAPMGEFLRGKLGVAYVNVGFLFDHGAFQAVRPSAQGLMGLREFDVDASPKDSLAAAFHRTGVPLALLDLRSCPRTGAAGAWLRAPHAVREAGAFLFAVPQMWTLPMPMIDRFDALLFVDATTRSRPLSLGR